MCCGAIYQLQREVSLVGVILGPMLQAPFRLLIIGKKRLPTAEGHERFFGFVEATAGQSTAQSLHGGQNTRYLLEPIWPCLLPMQYGACMSHRHADKQRMHTESLQLVHWVFSSCIPLQQHLFVECCPCLVVPLCALYHCHPARDLHPGAERLAWWDHLTSPHFLLVARLPLDATPPSDRVMQTAWRS